MALHARLVGRTLAGEYLGSIPLPLEASIDLSRHDCAVATVSYPVSGPRSELISREGAIWAVEVAEDTGEWIEPPNARFFTNTTGDDKLSRTRVWQIGGVHVGWRILRGEIVGREGTINEDGYRVLSAVTPGQVMRELITTAQARGSLSGHAWGQHLTINFTATADSAGNAWPSLLTLSLPVQRSIGDVLDDLVEDGAVEFEWRGMELYLTAPGGLSRDRTLGRNPTVIRHFHVTEAPRQTSMVDACTDVDFSGDDGWHQAFGNPDSLAPLGRLVKPVSQGQTSTYATAKRRADIVLLEGREPKAQDTRAGSNSLGGPLPILDVRNGDRILLDSPTGPSVDVVGCNITFGAKETRWHWTLGTRLESTLARLRRKADLALTGAGVVGGDGTAPRPPGPDTRIPEQVVGLIAAPDTYIGADGNAVGRVVLQWTAVDHATDGTVLERLKRYEIYGRTTGEPSAKLITSVDGDTTTVEIDALAPGALWEYQVRAVSDGDQLGELSAIVTVAIDPDLDAPYRPTPPLLTASAGTITIRWDGKGEGAVAEDPLDMPPDLRSVNVWSYGTSLANPPTYVGSLDGTSEGDSIIVTGIASGSTYYFDLTAIDRSGNVSARSDEAHIVGRSVADDPEVVNELGASLVADSAWIGSLRAVIVTADMFKGQRFELSDGGVFTSGPTDTDRWELSGTGLVEYDEQNRKMASWEPGQGIRLYNTAGQVTTQLSTQDYGLSVRNPRNNVLTPASSIIFGGTMNQSGAPADWISLGLYPNQASGWIESSVAADIFTWDHAGGRAVVWFSFEAYSTLNGVNPPVNLVQKAFRIKRVSDGVTVYDSSGNLNGISSPPGLPQHNDDDNAYFQGNLFCAFILAPDTYRFVPMYRIGTSASGSGIGYTSIRQRSVAIAQW